MARAANILNKRCELPTRDSPLASGLGVRPKLCIFSLFILRCCQYTFILKKGENKTCLFCRVLHIELSYSSFLFFIHL
jgi:hypothetical protein